ncbi:MAG TPA: NADH-quinone oxidoreductase subunit C [Spirochaetia bacterium]|nr:NADH-quinone oxidoreductase subunit C [Spirochaetia bacterium]
MSDPTSILKPWSLSVSARGENRLDVEIAPSSLVSAVTEIKRARWGYLSAITGRDCTEADGGGSDGAVSAAAPAPLEILYHFSQGADVLTLRTKVPREGASIPSVCAVLPSAILQERELAETFGIRVIDIPQDERLLLSDDWPDGLYPMRKEHTSEKLREVVTGLTASASGAAAATAPSAVPLDVPRWKPGPAKPVEEKPGRFVIPIGPQHPALKEPAHFELVVDGEVVTDATLRLGYVHRGIEKAAESQTWVQNLYLMERICGICSHIHATAYALGVEKLAGITAPPRAQAIRLIFAEMERLHSHLLWLGVAAHQAGYDTLFMFSWRDRETIMDLLDALSGNRVNYSANLVGGVKYDIEPKQADGIRRGLDFIEPRLQHYLKIVTTDESFLRRTRGVGIFPKEQAEIMGVVGPTARASGVRRDLRVDAPYLGYREFPIVPVFDDACDLAARFVVRIKELFESCRIIRSALDRLPAGDLTVGVPRRIPEGEAISRVEAPRGELFYYLRSTGGAKPDRVKVRTPSLANWAYVLGVAVGHRLADIPMIVVGIDPCFSCNDRMIRVRRAGEERTMSWEDLRQYGIRFYGGNP